MINNDLVKYIELNIIPKYEDLDLAHRSNHAIEVISNALEIAKDYDINLEMVYVVAAFHDLGLLVDRKMHHIIGGEMLENDSFVKNYFSKIQIKIMKEAVEDHRASLKNPPRSIYGKIIAEADRSSDMADIVRRCFLFDLSKNENPLFEESYERVLAHIRNKYGVNGYLTVWLKTKRVEDMLADLRKLLNNEEEFEKYCLNIFNEITLKGV